MIAAIVLAAGRATRFDPEGGATKLLALDRGAPIVRHVVESVSAAGVAPVFVVTGHLEVEVRASLVGLDPTFVRNGDFNDGLSSSIRAGLDALPADTSGALFLLGDMPRVRPTTLRGLVSAFQGHPGVDAVVPRHEGAWGNPVLIGRSLFAELAALEGDTGARALLRQKGRDILFVDVNDEGVLIDIDRAEDLAKLKARDPS